MEPEPAGPDEKLPNLTEGTTTGLGRTGETETGQAKLPTGQERAGETETELAKLPDKAGRETTTETDAPTELELDTTGTGLEKVRAATEPGETATVGARLPNGAGLDTGLERAETGGATGREQAATD